MKPKTKKLQEGMPTPEIGSLASRAMLVHLVVHWWEGATIDQKITQDTNKKYKADGRYSKRLIPLEDMLPMRSKRIVVQNLHKRYTLPWSDDGWHIVASGSFQEYDKQLRAAIAASEAEYDKFPAVYQKKMEEKKRDDTSFNLAHYPSVKEIRSKYGYSRHFKPVPVGNDLRVDLSADALAAVRASIDADQQDRIKTAVFDIADRLQKTVGLMVEKLRAYKPATKQSKAENYFQDSLIANVADLAGLIPKINITGDPRIEMIAVDLLKLTAKVTPDELRDEEKIRLTIADEAEKILKRTSDFI